ncbi:ribonuclease [Sphingomonas bacterium]|uniref:ribonuclease n=1 Tax=Sphingomonas bacterium TaxID=1895847 RepID=UPI002606C2BE|nr:ribonuclease [Sphingomonas bacterium]MDB5680119.1 ribonuclease [Sphingomonas bacterium]
MAEWLYEAGIGEARAALVEDGRIIEARIERPGGLRVGTVFDARLVERVAAGLSRVESEAGAAVIAQVPQGVTEGARLRVEVVREALPEAGRIKLAKVVASDAALVEGPDLLALCEASGHPVRTLHAHEPDALEAAGWSEVLDEALTGEIAFAGGALRLSPTPAMTLFDVDGPGTTAALAVAAAAATAQAIVRHDIGGSIGIDFPTVTGKAERLAVAAAIDAALPQPFERTALNGFGFLQIVRPRPRASLPELLRSDPVAAEALALLRQIERTPPPVPAEHIASLRVIAWLDRNPHLIAELSRRSGVAITLRGSNGQG